MMPARAKHDLVVCGGVDDDHDHQLASAWPGSAVSGPHGTGRPSRAPAPARVDIAHHALRAPLAQAQRDGQAHVADADDPDAHVVLRSGRQLCISRRLRATDIRMPSASPSDTIAVPP
jgi:hypothetical protein